MSNDDAPRRWTWPDTIDGRKALAEEVRELAENLEDVIFVLRDDGARLRNLGLDENSRLYQKAEEELIPLLKNLVELRDRCRDAAKP